MKKGLVGGLSLGVASATALNFDHPTSGSPFKGHKNVVQEGRLPLGDLSNRDSGKGINEHMQSTWDFHKVSNHLARAHALNQSSGLLANQIFIE